MIGLGCRFPKADNPEAFWSLLREGRDAVDDAPPGRWNVEAFYDPDPNVPGKMYTKRGAFLDRVDTFDPAFFGIAPREAVTMDPQQRLFLEVAWEALEDAGLPPDRLGGSSTGVFLGICNNDYAHTLARAGVEAIDAYTGTGTTPSIAAGRLSHILGLQGPCMTVDTACSSSLVALDLAVQHLRSGRCDQALVGGVNLLLMPESTVYFCKVARPGAGRPLQDLRQRRRRLRGAGRGVAWSSSSASPTRCATATTSAPWCAAWRSITTAAATA